MRTMEKKEMAMLQGERKERKEMVFVKRKKKKEKKEKKELGKNFLEASLKEQRRVIEIYKIPLS